MTATSPALIPGPLPTQPKAPHVFFPNLDGLRFLAFSAIFLIHSFYTPDAGIAASPLYQVSHQFTRVGNLGVNMIGYMALGGLVAWLYFRDERLTSAVVLGYRARLRSRHCAHLPPRYVLADVRLLSPRPLGAGVFLCFCVARIEVRKALLHRDIEAAPALLLGHIHVWPVLPAFSGPAYSLPTAAPAGVESHAAGRGARRQRRVPAAGAGHQLGKL